MSAEVPLLGELSQAFLTVVPRGIWGPAWFGMNKEVAQLYEPVSILVGRGTPVERLPAKRVKNELESVKEPIVFNHPPNSHKSLPLGRGQRAAASSNWEGVISHGSKEFVQRCFKESD